MGSTDDDMVSILVSSTSWLRTGLLVSSTGLGTGPTERGERERWLCWESLLNTDCISTGSLTSLPPYRGSRASPPSPVPAAGSVPVPATEFKTSSLLRFPQSPLRSAANIDTLRVAAPPGPGLLSDSSARPATQKLLSCETFFGDVLNGETGVNGLFIVETCRR